MITIKFFSLLRLLIKQREILLDENNITVFDLLNKAQDKIPIPFIQKLLDENKHLHGGTIILINGSNIFHMNKLKTMVKDGDIVSLFPPGGGG